MQTRAELHALLESILGPEVRVYFQPPANVHLRYPALVYERDSNSPRFADNLAYDRRWRYSLTYITKDPDDENVEKLLEIPFCSHGKHFVSDLLHHDTYTIYW